MAHMVRYLDSDDLEQLAPSVTHRVGQNQKNAFDDVRLISTLLHMLYQNWPLPRGAVGVIKSSDSFTDQTDLFIRDFQKIDRHMRADGIVSVLPLGSTWDVVAHYMTFKLYQFLDIRIPGLVIAALEAEPHLGRLGSTIYGPALQEVPAPEVIHGDGGIVSGAAN
jgi:hypothetical protein